MKNGFFAFGLLATFALFAFAGTLKTHSVDVANSVINWKGYKVTGEHAGTLSLKSGELQFEEGKLMGGKFEIDMSTLIVTDLQGGYAKKLEGHLKSPDFFGVESYPMATFISTKIIPKGTPGDYKVTGNLTIKETTKEIKFYAHVSEDGKSATADIKVDRTDFDVRYGSGSFFDGLGDKTIYDEFDLIVNLVLN